MGAGELAMEGSEEPILGESNSLNQHQPAQRGTSPFGSRGEDPNNLKSACECVRRTGGVIVTKSEDGERRSFWLLGDEADNSIQANLLVLCRSVQLIEQDHVDGVRRRGIRISKRVGRQRGRLRSHGGLSQCRMLLKRQDLLTFAVFEKLEILLAKALYRLVPIITDDYVRDDKGLSSLFGRIRGGGRGPGQK